MKVGPSFSHLRSGMSRNVGFLAAWVVLVLIVAAGAGAGRLVAEEQTRHTGTKVEGFATVVTPGSITVFDKKNQEIEIQTDKDYTSLVGIAAPVTVWYTTKDGVNHLEYIVYAAKTETFVPANEIGQGIRRVIILPEPQDVQNAQGLMDAISKYLSANSGWYVEPAELAAEIATRDGDSDSMLDSADPDDDYQQFLEHQRTLARQIAKETRTDAVLEVRLVKVKAKVRGSVASWDGMTESVASWKSRALVPWEGVAGNGWVYAATADMRLWGKSGNLLWKARRGFAVLAVQSTMARYHERPLTEVYSRADFMQRWLEDTLGELARGGPAGAPASMPPTRPDQPEKATPPPEDAR